MSRTAEHFSCRRGSAFRGQGWGGHQRRLVLWRLAFCTKYRQRRLVVWRWVLGTSTIPALGTKYQVPALGTLPRALAPAAASPTDPDRSPPPEPGGVLSVAPLAGFWTPSCSPRLPAARLLARKVRPCPSGAAHRIALQPAQRRRLRRRPAPLGSRAHLAAVGMAAARAAERARQENRPAALRPRCRRPRKYHDSEPIAIRARLSGPGSPAPAARLCKEGIDGVGAGAQGRASRLMVLGARARSSHIPKRAARREQLPASWPPGRLWRSGFSGLDCQRARAATGNTRSLVVSLLRVAG